MNDKWKKLRFGIATDSHYASKKMVNNKYYSQSLDKMKEFVGVMNQEKVDFVIHLGDFKDEGESQETAETLSFLQQIEEIFTAFDGPTYHCVGNHDVDSITKKEFLENVTNTGISKDESYYSFDLNGFHLVVLDASFNAGGSPHYFKDGGHFEDAHIPEKELDWLKDDLNKTNLPTLVFCHYLLFPKNKWGYRFEVAEHAAVRRILENAGPVLAVFHGHIHHEFYEKINGIHYIVHGAMVDGDGIENNSYSIVEIENGGIVVKGYRNSSNRSYVY